MEEKKDLQSRKWMITINNPLKWGFTHEKIREELNAIKNVDYWALCDEVGLKEHTPHTHIIFYRKGAIRWSTLNKHFPCGKSETLRGTLNQARDYIRKEGKFKGSSKEETNLKDTFEESGFCPIESQGSRNDLNALYDLIKDGKTDYEILEENPFYMDRLDKISRCREIIRYEQFKNCTRDVHVEYWYGTAGTGKTSGVFALHNNFSDVYRVLDWRNPWDGYKGQDIVLFDEFRSSLYEINEMLVWLDRYPLELRCRYANKQACFTKVYICSNLSLESQYMELQRFEKSTWEAFLRRINVVKYFDDKGVHEYPTVDSYINRFKNSSGFMKVSESEQLKLDAIFGN